MSELFDWELSCPELASPPVRFGWLLALVTLTVVVWLAVIL